MSKEIGSIRFTEDDGAMRIEITGDKLKEKFAGFCGCDGKEMKFECCSDSDKKDGDNKCC